MATKIPPAGSEGEALLKVHLRADSIFFETQFKFKPGRKWAADFAIPHWRALPLLVEVEGGVYAGGRHTRGKGFEADCLKYNAAAMMGYRLLRFSTGQVDSGLAIETIKAAIK